MKTQLTTLVCTGLAVLLGASASVAEENGAQDADDEKGHHADVGPRVRIGFKIAPVPLNLQGKNPALVGLGSYLVNSAGGCNDCHTWPNYALGGNPFLGEPEIINTEQYMSGGRQFGPITSDNITPDEFGRPAGLTFEEFEHLIRTGEEAPGQLMQVMPWPVYRNLTRYDLRAIYTYLSAIPSLPDNPMPSP